MAKFVWVNRADGMGQDAIDLYQCRRFLVGCPDPTNPVWEEEYCVYYLTGDGRWVRDWYKDDDTGRHYQTYTEEHPIQVAHDFMRNSHRLHPDLEQFREIASDWDRYTDWRNGRSETAQPHIRPDKPRFAKDEKFYTL